MVEGSRNKKSKYSNRMIYDGPDNQNPDSLPRRGETYAVYCVLDIGMPSNGSLTITENADPDVRRDLDTVLQRLAPDGDPAYRHNDEGPDDMAAHVRNVLTDTGITVPVGDGRMLLGTWQGIFLWEHRTAPHRRSVVVTVLG
jgi:secondary thiamine-phosphate synthase enzyme